MKDRKLKITVEGRANTGKTTVGLLIQQALEKHGIDVIYSVDEHESNHNYIEAQKDKLHTILEEFKRDGIKIHIKEKQSGFTDPF
jgi:thymidylate kinase